MEGDGIEVRLDALADATAGAPFMCVEFSPDAGASWTAAKTTPPLTTAEATYLLGGPGDTWGRSWTLGEFSNASFRVRVTNVAADNLRDFSLDFVAVKVSYTPPPLAADTGFLAPSLEAADSGGDGNGYEVAPSNAFADDGIFAEDRDTGTGTVASCADPGRDRHRFFGYDIALPAGATVDGIQVRLDARIDDLAGTITRLFCVELSWDGGVTWTAPKTTANVLTAEMTLRLGGASDTWGRSWTPAELANGSLRVRITNVTNNDLRDFLLDWTAVRVFYTAPPAPTPTPTPTPTPIPTLVLTNDTGAPAGFLHLQLSPSYLPPLLVNAPGCGAPAVADGFEYVELTWPDACVDPGETVSFHVPVSVTVTGSYWAVSPPVVLATNDTTLAATGLQLTPATALKGAALMANAAGCPLPALTVLPGGRIDLFWEHACVNPGETVAVHLAAPAPITSASPAWTFTSADGDGDGCSDSEEGGSNPGAGGRRDRLNPYDFFDVPLPSGAPGTGARDKAVSISDIVAIVGKFGTAAGGPPNERGEVYNPDFDRTRAGGLPWELGPPDGAIAVGDIVFSVLQFGHSCLAPP